MPGILGRLAPRCGVRLALASALLAATVGGVNASCVSATMYDLAKFNAGERTALSRLGYNKLFVLCITAGANGFVQILDTPADGEVQVIYPNAQVNDGNGNQQYAAIKANEERCLGVPGTFPLYHPKEEGPSGKIAITLTLSEAQQLGADGWTRPGDVTRHLRSHIQDGNACTGRDVLYISYLAE